MRAPTEPLDTKRLTLIFGRSEHLESLQIAPVSSRHNRPSDVTRRSVEKLDDGERVRATTYRDIGLRIQIIKCQLL